jgi:hypothetical protein
MEYLGTEPPARRSGGRKWGIAALATVGVLGVAGAGAYAAGMLTGEGAGAAEAVPGNALAFLTLDLDPGVGQKVEAYRLMRKFPALAEKLGEGQDLRRSLVEGALADAPCEGLTFDDDFAPWLGNRVAVSAVRGDDEPVPFLVLEVTDREQAATGVEDVAACGGEDEGFGTAFVGDYLILAEDTDTAARIAGDTEAGSLADDDNYRRWVQEAGGDGIVTGYVSAEAPRLLLDEAVKEATSEPGTSAAGGVGDLSPEELEEQLGETVEEFEGGAMVLRLDDGALQLEVAASAVGEVVASDGGASGLADLPASTVLAFGVGIADGTVEEMLDELAQSVGQEELDTSIARAEAMTGLTLPEDLETLLGDGVSVALDSSVDIGAGVLGAPAGLRITGDPQRIVPVLEKLVAAVGVEEQVFIESGDGVVAVGLAPTYVARLAEDGDLGEQDGFRSALPDIDDSTGGLFVDFDTDDWLTELVEQEPDADELRENLEPLDSLGVSGRVDGDVMRATIRLSTD